MLTRDLVGRAIQQALANQQLSPQQLSELQERKFRELLGFAAAESPFYAKLYESIHVDTVPLAELPTVTKQMLQEHFDDVVTDRRLTLGDARKFCEKDHAQLPTWHLGEFAIMLSSGTTGRRGYFVMDGPALADAIAVGMRQATGQRHVEPQQPDRIAAVMLVEPFDCAGLLMRMIPSSVAETRLIDIRGDLADICDDLNEFSPTTLSSFPYMLRLLAEAALNGGLRIKPERITSSGDVLTASDRAAVRRAFGVELNNFYCSTEVPYIAWEGEDHSGLYVNADYVILESVDVNNNPVQPGQLGEKMLVTNLSNRAMPLIRYEMSDQVEYMAESGGQAGPLPRIRTVAGRVEHIIALPGAEGGRISLIPEHIDDFVGELDQLANYQIIQTEAARLIVNFIPRPQADVAVVAQSVLSGLQDCFRRYAVDPAVHIDLNQVDQLEPTRPGGNKVCQYWNRWK